jgi:hypothetical protein
VAYIRADASPSEVLAGTCWHRDQAPVKRSVRISSRGPDHTDLEGRPMSRRDALDDLRRTSTIAAAARMLSEIKYHTAIR